MPLIAAALVCLIFHVSDGDSVLARCEGPEASRIVRIRVAHIDAPELHQTYGPESKARLARLCLHRRAQITPAALDMYGRMVASLQCDGTDASADQLRSGLAWLSTRDAHARQALQPLQSMAQRTHAGLWVQQRPMAPWDYRKRYGTPYEIHRPAAHRY
ncbi:thermonuclease family protein [Diaphorobacter ruginosibacter]|uniref:Thermonuclease family protein n=1 Tax=Diaphorobacter ruginosibacter TaxID=1715720 RepID=A0A7G9RST8_9BURK|nr:thermonuclease family protein [Diaphorobacter ruginosibacter]QNN58663.1 thermonuclease family protein [Diaphorobacter ruginosibacter]